MPADKLPEVISVPLGEHLQAARLIERPNRFIVRCQLERSGRASESLESREVQAHLADPGRLKELLVPGTRLWLSPASLASKGVSGRKTSWSAVLCEAPDSGTLISLDSTLPNQLIFRALQQSALPEFGGWNLLRREFAYGHSRWDFLLRNQKGEHLILEVKSVTLVQNGVALFPDAVTARGTRHVSELAAIAREEGYRAALLFVVQREDAKAVTAADQIDPVFADTLKTAKRHGVQISARRCFVTLKALTLGPAIAVL